MGTGAWLQDYSTLALSIVTKRKIQSVQCASRFAMDHTHEVVKKYQTRKAMGAFACFDVANENGEIATAVLVPLTQAKHVAHAAHSALPGDQTSNQRQCTMTHSLRGSASGSWSSTMLEGDLDCSTSCSALSEHCGRIM